MVAISQSRMKRLVAIHGWSGTILGLLLYVVIVTGAVAVFAHEIGLWSQGGEKYSATLTEPIDAHVRKVAATVDQGFFEEISIWKGTDGTLTVFFHTHKQNPETGQIDDYGVDIDLNPETGETLARKEGFGSWLRNADPSNALERFLVDLHVRLYIPEPWGLILTGVLGLLVLAASVSGFLMHRHMFRDIFYAPKTLLRLVDMRDRHTLVSTWLLPFSLVLGFTGAFFSFAESIGLPVVATVAFKGDQMAMMETLFGHEHAGETIPHHGVNIDTVLQDATARIGTAPTLLTIENWGTSAMELTTMHNPQDGDLTGQQMAFNGVDGSFMGQIPSFGKSPSLGSAAIDLMSPLHFGDFSGLASKITWFALGLGMAFTVASGLQFWVRRRADSQGWLLYEKAIDTLIWGLPICMLVSASAYFVSIPSGAASFWTPAGFVITALILVPVGLSFRSAGSLMRSLMMALCISLPILRQSITGADWITLIQNVQLTVIAVDAILITCGVTLLAKTYQNWMPRKTAGKPAE
ncbi:MAG: PepSY-associated TM helix domain-containing protein [Pseudomonadota bacterium]